MKKAKADVDINPHNICTWDENSDCKNCGDHNLLFCKIDKKIANAFIILFAPCMIIAFFCFVVLGIMTGKWWFIIAYGAFTAMLFPVIEFGVLCRHCPFYGREGAMLSCISGSGVPKTYKYDPRPLNKFERFVMYCYYTFMIGFPIFSIGYGIYFLANNMAQFGNIALLGMIGLEVAFVFTIITFNYCLNVYVCRKCINFSCPWNKVEKSVVDEYLRKNPFLREAWEKTGYKLGE